jgi:hypothetical protein
MTNSDIFFQGSAIYSIGVRAQNLLIGSASTNITIQSRCYSMAGQILQVQPTGPGLRRLHFSLRRFDSRFQLGGGGDYGSSALFSLRRFYSYLAYRAGITAYLFSSVYGDFTPIFSLQGRDYSSYALFSLLRIRSCLHLIVSGLRLIQSLQSTASLLISSAYIAGITTHPL